MGTIMADGVPMMQNTGLVRIKNTTNINEVDELLWWKVKLFDESKVLKFSCI